MPEVVHEGAAREVGGPLRPVASRDEQVEASVTGRAISAGGSP